MSLVKFECPVCNQNMECERACSGNVIHCPGCGAEIRIPFHNPAELLGTISRAELVALPPGTASHDATHPGTEHQTEKHEHEAKVNCPACQAELKVVIPDKGAASTSLLRAPPAPERKEPPPAETAHPDLAHMSLEEREKQIARAREENPVQANPTMKPRLDYVLEGKAPPPMEKADQKPGEGHDDSTTLAE